MIYKNLYVNIFQTFSTLVLEVSQYSFIYQTIKDPWWLFNAKEVIDAFILSIIVLDRNNVVFILNSSGTMDVDDIKEKRKQIIKRQSVYENTIFLRDPIKLMTLHYTVVLV